MMTTTTMMLQTSQFPILSSVQIGIQLFPQNTFLNFGQTPWAKRLLFCNFEGCSVFVVWWLHWRVIFLLREVTCVSISTLVLAKSTAIFGYRVWMRRHQLAFKLHNLFKPSSRSMINVIKLLMKAGMAWTASSLFWLYLSLNFFHLALNFFFLYLKHRNLKINLLNW